MLRVRKFEWVPAHCRGQVKTHKGEMGPYMCFTLINEFRQPRVFLMYPRELGRLLLLLLLFYSPTTSLQYVLFSGLCPWKQNKLHIFFLQPLMNINVAFIYCLAKYDKNKNALQRKRTCIHQKYPATVRVFVSSSLSINAPSTSALHKRHHPAVPFHHWPFLKDAAGSLAAALELSLILKLYSFVMLKLATWSLITISQGNL